MVESELDKIEGIGQNTMKKLFLEYNSLDDIKKASLEELSKTIGKHKAEILLKYFKD